MAKDKIEGMVKTTRVNMAKQNLMINQWMGQIQTTHQLVHKAKTTAQLVHKAKTTDQLVHQTQKTDRKKATVTMAKNKIE
jgi:hypothetical protein